MMMSPITRDQAQALAALIGTLRDDWDPQGVMSALASARDRGDAWDLAHAAITAAATPTNRTPAVIAMAGPHWATPGVAQRPPQSVPRPDDPRCDRDGHEHELARNCRSCRADTLGWTDPPDTPIAVLTPEQAAINARGAALIRQALAAGTHHTLASVRPSTTPDHAERAAGEK